VIDEARIVRGEFVHDGARGRVAGGVVVEFTDPVGMRLSE
jgi:hypothetical protein